MMMIKYDFLGVASLLRLLAAAAIVSSTMATTTTEARSLTMIRNFKKGLAMHTAESCNALKGHETSSWWYSWGAKSGFDDSFCLDEEQEFAVSDARDSGMEFVPMFWGGVPAFDGGLGRVVDDEIHENLERSRYLLTFNEPELDAQANLSPNQAATMWSSVETIANAYNVQIVGPCVTQDHGVGWYKDWTTECNSLYGRDCRFEFTCLHMYYQPYTYDNLQERCDSSDHAWACIQQGSEQGPTRAASKLNEWATNYPGKRIWVTEYACAPWGSTNGCSPQEHVDIMNQLTPLLESSESVFRYSWFGLYGGEEHSEDWYGNGLNDNVWTRYEGVGCDDREWIAGFGTDADWKIQTIQECLSIADSKEVCEKPLKLSIDDEGCYCSLVTDSENGCDLVSTWGAMTTWIEVGPRDSSSLTSIGDLYETFGTTEQPTPRKKKKKEKCKKVESKEKIKFYLKDDKNDDKKKKMKANCKQIKKNKWCKQRDVNRDPLYLKQCPYGCRKKIPKDLLDDFWCKLSNN